MCVYVRVCASMRSEDNSQELVLLIYWIVAGSSLCLWPCCALQARTFKQLFCPCPSLCWRSARIRDICHHISSLPRGFWGLNLVYSVLSMDPSILFNFKSFHIREKILRVGKPTTDQQYYEIFKAKMLQFNIIWTDKSAQKDHAHDPFFLFFSEVV